jgi:hypothetical protein
MLLFEDVRLTEALGAALLYAATLLGVLLLARLHFGVGAARLTVALFGLSEPALAYAVTV